VKRIERQIKLTGTILTPQENLVISDSTPEPKKEKNISNSPKKSRGKKLENFMDEFFVDPGENTATTKETSGDDKIKLRQEVEKYKILETIREEELAGISQPILMRAGFEPSEMIHSVGSEISNMLKKFNNKDKKGASLPLDNTEENKKNTSGGKEDSTTSSIAEAMRTGKLSDLVDNLFPGTRLGEEQTQEPKESKEDLIKKYEEKIQNLLDIIESAKKQIEANNEIIRLMDLEEQKGEETAMVEEKTNDDELFDDLFGEKTEESNNNNLETIGYLKTFQDGVFHSLSKTPENCYFRLFNQNGNTANFEFSGDEQSAIANKDSIKEVYETSGGSIDATNIKNIEPGFVTLQDNKTWKITQKAKIRFIHSEEEVKAIKTAEETTANQQPEGIIDIKEILEKIKKGEIKIDATKLGEIRQRYLNINVDLKQKREGIVKKLEKTEGEVRRELYNSSEYKKSLNIKSDENGVMENGERASVYFSRKIDEDSKQDPRYLSLANELDNLPKLYSPDEVKELSLKKYIEKYGIDNLEEEKLEENNSEIEEKIKEIERRKQEEIKSMLESKAVKITDQNFNFKMIGTPTGFDMSEDVDYKNNITFYQNNYDGVDNAIKKFQLIKRNDKIIYMYKLGNFMTATGRKGSFLGMSIELDSIYSTDIKGLEDLLDSIFNELILEKFHLVEKTTDPNHPYKFKIDSFTRRDSSEKHKNIKEIEEIKKIILYNFQNPFKEDFRKIDKNFNDSIQKSGIQYNLHTITKGGGDISTIAPNYFDFEKNEIIAKYDKEIADLKK
jgi:hypothetical protein